LIFFLSLAFSLSLDERKLSLAQLLAGLLAAPLLSSSSSSWRTMFRKTDSSGDLAPAVERLHALADRLEVNSEIEKEKKEKKMPLIDGQSTEQPSISLLTLTFPLQSLSASILRKTTKTPPPRPVRAEQGRSRRSGRGCDDKCHCCRSVEFRSFDLDLDFKLTSQ
jgi:hypothetical protein